MWLHWVVSSATVVVDTVKTYLSKLPFRPAIGLLGRQRPLEEISSRNLEEKLKCFLAGKYHSIYFNCGLGLNANY